MLNVCVFPSPAREGSTLFYGISGAQFLQTEHKPVRRAGAGQEFYCGRQHEDISAQGTLG